MIQVEITIGKWKNDSIGDLIGKISEELDDKYKQVVTKNKELIEQVVESNLNHILTTKHLSITV